ncbi:hypothetical protein [Aeoliella sp.]|uniref:hypothetical protein n=1 Tax=Aeoliella sp. TaxID=2795800 RepID=UPI003CCC37EF
MNLAVLNLLVALTIAPVAEFGAIPHIPDSNPDFADSRFVEPVRGSFRPAAPEEGFSLNGMWQLSWDDTVGRELTGEVKNCNIRFRVIDGKVEGQFDGRVAGTLRDAIIDGQLVEHADGNLLTFQQREQGYVCSYQIGWPASSSLTEVVGVWHDSKGRSGNFSFLAYQ